MTGIERIAAEGYRMESVIEHLKTAREGLKAYCDDPSLKGEPMHVLSHIEKAIAQFWEREDALLDDQKLLSSQKGETFVRNKDIKETAMGIALEFFDYPLFPGEAKDDFLAKRDLIAFGIKLLLKRSKIPCEENGLFVETE
jgi:hypothetical protein